AGKYPFAMVLVQLQDFRTRINPLASRRWPSRWRSAAGGHLPEVTKKLSHTFRVAPCYGVIQMVLPAGFGIKMGAAQPANPSGLGLNFPPIQYRAIERLLKLAPLGHSLGIGGWEPRHRSRLPHSRWKRSALEIIRGEQGPHLRRAELEREIDQLIDAVAAHQLLCLAPLCDERDKLINIRIDSLASTHDGQPPIMLD